MKTQVSVAMAVWNGEKYLRQQIESILCQLGEHDELVISLDPSIDMSGAIIAGFADRDKRIRVVEGPGRGAIHNFENALNHTNGEVIFLSDQDDIWEANKLSSCLAELDKKDTLAVVHNAIVADEDANISKGMFFENGFYSGVLRNIVRNRYIGCCMAFKKELLRAALPFPKNLPMHDQWLGITAKKFGNVAYIDTPLIRYRRHRDTLTGRKKAGFLTRIRWRINIAADYIKLGNKKRYGFN